MLQILE
jgi:hypothetical protein